MLSSANSKSTRSWCVLGLVRVAERTQRLRRELAGGGVAAVALLGLFGQFAVNGVVGHQRDTGAFYFPLTAWLASELAAGRLPLWCPLIFAGYPIVADGEIGLLYPPNILMLTLLPVDVAFVVVRAAHYLLAAAGLYALARVLGVRRIGSAFGGVAFALGGFMIGHLDHGNIIRSAAWLPLMLACADLALRARDGRRWLWLALGAAALALACLGLHPQIVLIELVALGLFTGLRALALACWGMPPSDWVRNADSPLWFGLRGALAIGVITALGLAGAAIQLLPTYELGEVSSRGGDGLTYFQASAGGLALVDLLTLLLPYGFRADPAVQWMRYPYWESTVYAGVVGLVTAIVGLAFGARRVVLPLLGLGIAGLLLAMSINAPIDVYAWLWTLPGYSSMRAPVRYGLIFELAVALLAAVGVDRLGTLSVPRGARVLAALLAVTLLGAVQGGRWMRDWLVADESGALQRIQETYLLLPRDRPDLSAEAVRQGLLGTMTLENPWTLLAVLSAATTVGLLLVWAWRARGAAWLSGAVVAVGVAELVMVAHEFHPTIAQDRLHEASRPMQFLSEQPGLWRAFLAGRSDLSVTSRPALFGVAQAYGYSSLPTTRMERYWTRINEVDDDLLDLWNVRYFVEAKGEPGRQYAHGLSFDSSRPLLDGPPGSPLGDERFSFGATPADSVRLLAHLTDGASVPDGEPVGEIVVHGAGADPVTLIVRAGEHVSEAAYDENPSQMAHRKATVGVHWEPRDPAGRVFPRDIYLADFPLPATMQVETVEVRALVRQGGLRVVGLGLHEYSASAVRSILPAHRSKYRVVFDSDSTVIYENQAVTPRAFLAPRAVSLPSDEWSIMKMIEGRRDPRETVMLEHAGAAGVTTVLDGGPLAPDEVAEITRYEPDRVSVRVRAQEARYLVLSDTYFPGWQAYIDGEPVEIERANFLFRAVRVPAGEHVVEWRYLPPSVLYGGAVTALALAVMIALAARGLAVRRAPVQVTAPARPRAARGAVASA